MDLGRRRPSSLPRGVPAPPRYFFAVVVDGVVVVGGGGQSPFFVTYGHRCVSASKLRVGAAAEVVGFGLSADGVGVEPMLSIATAG